MSAKNIIKRIMLDKKITVRDLASKLGLQPQVLSNKLYRDTFSYNEFVKIAGILGCDVITVSTDTDIEYTNDHGDRKNMESHLLKENEKLKQENDKLIMENKKKNNEIKALESDLSYAWEEWNNLDIATMEETKKLKNKIEKLEVENNQREEEIEKYKETQEKIISCIAETIEDDISFI